MVNTAAAAFENVAGGRGGPSRPTLRCEFAGVFNLGVYDSLAAIEDIWRAFESNADCTAFQTFEWLSTWQRHIGEQGGFAPLIVVARDAAGAVLFILPLATHRTGLVRELVWLGSDLCDYNAPLLAADFSQRITADEFFGLWQSLLALLRDSLLRVDAVHLDKMPETVRLQRNPMLALKTALHPSGAYATPLAESWDAFYAAKRSSATRRRDRAKRKRLEQHGKLELVTAKTAQEAIDTINVLAEQKSAHFAKAGIANLFAQPGYLDFLKDFVSRPDAAGLAHISVLRVGSQTAATNFALTFGGRYYHVLASYTDGQLSRFGPGAAHLQELLHYAIDRRFAIFDFTIGDEPYKLDWCDGVSSLHDHVSTVTLRGALRVWPLVLFKAVKRTIKQTPALWACFMKLRVLLAYLGPRASGADLDARDDGG